jgi:Bacterial TniB protein
MLAAHQTKIAIFDEVQHICHTRSRDRAVVLDTIKSISTECQISVICAGTPSVERELASRIGTSRPCVVTRSIWYQTSKRLTDGWRGTQILSPFERFDAPDDRKANCALASVLQAWASGNTSDEGSEPPVLLENRIEVLQQAISLLEK